MAKPLTGALPQAASPVAGVFQARRKATDALKRLVRLWLICAAIGFVVAAGLAVMMAYALDGPAGAARAPARLELAR